MLVSATTLVAVRRVTDAAERVTSTLDTSERVPEKGKDELGRLAVSFNSMLAALQEAIETQKRFVADASHELLTPVTSLQTNLEVLAKAPRLPAEKRKDLIGDVLGELREVRKLIGSLVELARGKNGEQRLQHQRHSIAVVRGGDLVGDLQKLGVRARDGDAATGPLEHRDVVQHVAEGDHLARIDLELGA